MKEAKASPVMAGAWAWGAGFAGGDQVFGAALDAAALKPVVEKALELGIRSFDTAAIYGNGSSEAILGELLKGIPRESVVISTKFTPQIAASSTSAAPTASTSIPTWSLNRGRSREDSTKRIRCPLEAAAAPSTTAAGEKSLRSWRQSEP